MLIFATATFAIITASPLVWMVSASLKEPAEIFNSSLIPQHPTLENFRYVFAQLPFIRYILNTFFVAGTITVIALLFHSMAGFAFARLRFPGRETIFLTIFSTFLVSLQVIIVPLFILVQKMGMVNTQRDKHIRLFIAQRPAAGYAPSGCLARSGVNEKTRLLSER